MLLVEIVGVWIKWCIIISDINSKWVSSQLWGGTFHLSMNSSGSLFFLLLIFFLLSMRIKLLLENSLSSKVSWSYIWLFFFFDFIDFVSKVANFIHLLMKLLFLSWVIRSFFNRWWLFTIASALFTHFFA